MVHNNVEMFCMLTCVATDIRYAKTAGYTCHDIPNIANTSIGGLGIYIKHAIPSKVIGDKRDNTSAEYLGVEIFPDRKTITIINVYNPHDSEPVPKTHDSMIHIAYCLTVWEFSSSLSSLGL